MAETHYPEWLLSELQQLPKLIEKNSALDEVCIRAIRAKYDVRKKLIQVDLQNGASFSFPPHLAQGLQNASSAQLANIEVSPMGIGLSWPLLDADLTVEGLLNGVFGSRAWMRAHAAKAGRVRS